MSIYYVATDRDGVQRHDEGHHGWQLPPPSDASGALVLSTVKGLIGHLDERIFVAELSEPAAGGARAPDGNGRARVAALDAASQRDQAIGRTRRPSDRSGARNSYRATMLRAFSKQTVHEPSRRTPAPDYVTGSTTKEKSTSQAASPHIHA